MSTSISCIYLIENKLNNKKYIGQAVDYDRRIKEHKNRYKNNDLKSQRSYLYRAMRKYGIENFCFSVVQECSVEELNTLEKFYIKKYKSFENGYNMTEGGQNDQPNRKLEEEDVFFLRELYASKTKMSLTEIWEEYFKDKITFNYFRNLWKGQTWKHIMPEVFTENNKKYYRSKKRGIINKRAAFLDEEVIALRTRYVNETVPSIYKGHEDKISLRGMEALLRGQTYSHLPVYKKKEKRWITSGRKNCG